MIFNPCNGKCTREGTHCEGCGRSLEEVAELGALVQSLVDYANKKAYENKTDFAAAVGKSVQWKLENPPQ